MLFQGASGREYFTIVQYDDGILASRDELYFKNLRVFGAGGYGTDPIPLTSDKHPVSGRKWKAYLASFLGSVGTHPMRRVMFDKFKDADGFLVEDVYTRYDTALLDRYRRMTEESYFVLCPRGYGKTSYRMYEAMQLGAVPVYISDVHWLPFTQYLDWSKFAVIVKWEEMDALPGMLRQIIDSGKYQEMRKNAIDAYNNYFEYTACFKTIKRILEDENDKRAKV